MKSLVIMLSLLGMGTCMKLEVKPDDAVVDDSELGPRSKINASDTTMGPIIGIHNRARSGNIGYQVITIPNTFASAETYCRSHISGGHLASIHTSQQNSQVLGMLRGKKAWIGGLSTHQDKTFIWTDGSPFNFQNWAPGEPNNIGGKEFCIEMYSSGLWNDVPCDHMLPFTCEYNPWRCKDQVEEDDQMEVKE